MKTPSYYLALLFVSLFFSGILFLREPIKIGPYDIVFVSVAVLTILRVCSQGKLRIPGGFRGLLLLACAIFVWTTLQALRSPSPERAITLLLILLRDFSTMFLVALILTNWGLGLDSVTRSTFVASIVVCAVALCLFFYAIRNPSIVASNPRPGIIYRAGEGLIPHFQGFANNPIYFATLSLVLMLLGLGVPTHTKKGKVAKVGGLAFLFLVTIASFERGPFISLMAGLLSAILLNVCRPRVRRFIVHCIVRPFLVLLLVSIFLSSFVALPAYKTTFLERIKFRFMEARWETRLNRWYFLLTNMHEAIWLGYGLRSSEWTLGAQVVENSYVEILFEQGVIGVLLWGFLFGYVFLLGLNKARREPVKSTYLIIWVMLLVSMTYVTLHWDPLIWLMAGIITGQQKVSIPPATQSAELHRGKSLCC